MNDFTIQTMDELARRYYGTTGERKKSSASSGSRCGKGNLTSEDEQMLKDIMAAGHTAGNAGGNSNISRTTHANTRKGGTVSLQELAGK